MKCEARISIPGTFRDKRRCQKEGKLEHEGSMYCSAHHPPTKLAKRKEAARVFEEKWDRERYERKALQRETDLAIRALTYLRAHHPEIVAAWEGV